MKTDSEKSVFNVVGSPREIEGFIHGMRYPCAIVLLQTTISKDDTWLKSVNRSFTEKFQGKTFSRHLPDIGIDQTLPEYAAVSVLFWIGCLYESARVPVFENGKIIGVDPDDQLVMITLPVFSSCQKQAINLLLWILSIYNAAAAGDDFHQLLDRLPSIEKQIAPPPFSFSNTFNLLRAAFQEGIPCMAFSGEVYQLGYGSRSRLLESSFTDETSAIGTRLARIKTLASEVLSKAGIPVPEQRKVEDVRGAEKAAAELGFPVVVKPANLDGGVGVAAGLTTMDEVRSAFAIARQKSSHIILEKHIEGRDYRLRIFNNEILAALERIPGGVTGDGSSTIRQLVAQVNLDPDRGTSKYSLLRYLVLDDEALSLLKKRGMDCDSVPPEGEFITLRRRANISAGGTPRVVTEKVHPDNALLALRAARLLRLDFAGIDMLLPDISRSWMETGGVICEVNAQPNLGGIVLPNFYSHFFQIFIKDKGRIPIIVIAGAPDASDFAGKIESALNPKGLVTGIASNEGVTIGKTLVHGPIDLYAAGRMLLMEKSVDAVLFCVNDAGLLVTGLPFDRFDVFVAAGMDISMPAGTNESDMTVQLTTLADFLLPCCNCIYAFPEVAGNETFGPVLNTSQGKESEVVIKEDALEKIVSRILDFTDT